MKKHIPNTITACNLLCGAMAVYFSCEHMYAYAFLFICGGAFFDFFDGMTARALKVSGPLGVQMDSLADDITFGLAPAMMVMCYLKPLLGAWAYLALLMAAFSALRLAKFNIDERQHSSFIGLATPSNALFWAGICTMPLFPEINASEPVVLADRSPMMSILPWVLLALTFVSDYLLVCEVPFFSLKFKSFAWKDSSVQYVFLIGSVLLIAFCIAEAIRFSMLPYALFSGTIVIVWYVCINTITNLLHRL